MKTIYILLIRSTTILSKAIHLITSAPYTHVSISFEKSLQPLYSSSRKNSETMFPAGPCVECFHQGYLSKHLNIPCVLYGLTVSDEIYKKAKEETEKIVIESDNYSFNIIGLFLCQLQIPFHRRSHFFCSQFVGEILSRSNAIKLRKDPTILKPIDYTEMPELECKFVGTLSELVGAYSNNDITESI